MTKRTGILCTKYGTFRVLGGVDGYENGKSEISGKRRGSGTAEMGKISAEKWAEAIY